MYLTFLFCFVFLIKLAMYYVSRCPSLKLSDKSDFVITLLTLAAKLLQTSSRHSAKESTSVHTTLNTAASAVQSDSRTFSKFTLLPRGNKNVW